MLKTDKKCLFGLIWLLNNKFRGLSPSGGCASVSFDQGVPKKLPTTAPSSRSERHLTVFYIDQIVPGFVVYYLNVHALSQLTLF